MGATTGFCFSAMTRPALEVMAVELADGTLYVVHVMDLRDKYRSAYEEGTP